MRKISIIIITLMSLLCYNQINAQGLRILKVSIFRHKSLDANSQQKLVAELSSLLSHLKKIYPDLPYDSIQYYQFDYNDGPKELMENAIATINPLKYVKFKYLYKVPITPIFVTKKRDEQIPYYQALFIASKKSDISSIWSESIKTIYFVDTNSASGYLYPIHKLYNLGLIKSPDLNGALKKFKIVFCESHTTVEKAVLNDPYSIGATWDYSNWGNDSFAKVFPVLRYESIPQDPLVISNDLLPYKKDIVNWFNKMKADRNKLKESFKLMEISGLENYTKEHENSFFEILNKYFKMSEIAIKKENKIVELELEKSNSNFLEITHLFLCLFLFCGILFCSFKSNNTVEGIKYTNFAWNFITLFIISIIELIRFEFEHKLSIFFPESSILLQLVYLLIIFTFSYLSEYKILVVNSILSFIQSINSGSKRIMDGIQNSKEYGFKNGKTL